MRFTRLPLLSAAALSLFATIASAQTKLPDLDAAVSSQEALESSKAAGATKSKDDGASTTDSATKATGTATESRFSVTGAGSKASSIARITGASTGTNSLPKNLPTLAGAFVVVAPSVPPTADAPFMRASNLPEGTVFIVVGAILGFLAMSVLLWRMLVAWSLHRSVKRAALQQSGSQEKPLFRSPVTPFYKYKDHESSPNLGVINKKGQSNTEKRLSRPPTTGAAAAASNTSLFFSPTAGAAAGGINTAGNRGSNYLPAGYYAAGASQPGNGQGMAHLGNQNSISMSNLLPRDRYERASSYGPSPPGSPDMRPRGGSHGASRSTLNLNQAPGSQRAPSVFLDELFDGEGAPPVPGHGAQYGRL